MAEILPFRAWRYAPSFRSSIDQLTSPLFDVVSERQRQNLYQNPYNSIHLSVPVGPDPAKYAALTLQQWQMTNILQPDPEPGIYGYYQYFRLPGSARAYCRKGFICHIRTYDWEDRVLLRHENTLPVSVQDRVRLLEETQLHSSATHGLYTDPHFALEPYLDASMEDPLYETEDYQGVRDVLSVITDPRILKIFLGVLKQRQVLLADGHHRYQGSLEYKRDRMWKNPNYTGQEGYNFHLMYLTNTESDDLRILPTHRLLLNFPLSDEEFLEMLEPFFVVTPKEDAYELNEVIVGKPWAFGLYLSGKAFKLRLRPEVHAQLDWPLPPEVRNLDLTVLHYFVFEKILGMGYEEQRTSPLLVYDRNFTSCISQVDAGNARAAFITNEVSMEQVKRVSQVGALMPQKSTFFYPKVICGFLFSSIKENEFTRLSDIGL